MFTEKGYKMIEKKNFIDNDDVTIIAERGIFKVIEYRVN